ncbi:MAG TPA: hypothetical protein DGL25_01650, partial [Dehalococcoidia bacterium]|nr:hypothetical protein [Dehalococcoidia bacterium]
MRLFDSHCHLQDARFDKDRKEVLKRASAAGVAAVVVCGEDLASSKAAIALADQSVHPSILPAIGFHPHEAAGATDAALINIQKLAASSQVSAIGEIGLDFYREMAPRHVQRSVFDAQLAIASDMSLPVSIHSRDAEEDLRPHLVPFASKSPLKAQGRPLGVLHAFGGTLRQASEYAELGFLISLTCSAGY